MASPTVDGRLRGFWSFYRRYTTTPIHAAAAAALTIFGILVFVDPWFAALAIGAYVLPPVVLYVFDADAVPEGRTSPAVTEPDRRDRAPATQEYAPAVDRARTSGGGDTDTDSDTDRDDGDTDSDSDDGDTDSDTDDGDTDSDSDDGDTDSDSDDGDSDSDSDWNS
ncbi:hypothetical protein [Halosolutus gelatinilyticus]|uniref:hypothetical protein n=1 Tax=Halosolutus gelatinilyticus TaxID=2931975 RepID=UPI001FF1DD3E|nr:hypothetical protein [Halosolutus gelatinilyticus]